jgi:hypothetical protein
LHNVTKNHEDKISTTRSPAIFWTKTTFTLQVIMDTI